ncbi:armadillo-type protein [Catenaria anguillulae PL171]|uniref:Armadillo-type protein n=1 Tax=Catenaria anguillulae PL171 TaxID=765915 RepID=A0A1Y2HIT1_9FUNG|nr:armadillo-type protein [Catenaria anguillulae PL171]
MASILSSNAPAGQMPVTGVAPPATPASVQPVLDLLTSLCSQNVTQLRDAEQVLKRAELQPNFHLALQDIYFQPQLLSPQDDPDGHATSNIRFQAIRTLRANIERFWRRSPKAGCLAADEKAAIRARALHMVMVSHAEPRALVQASVAVSKMARLDYPNEWPSLLDDVLQLMDMNRELRDRGLLVLHHVIKALIGVRVGPTRRQMASIAPRLVHACVATFAECLQQPGDPNLATAALYSVKCLRKLLAFAVDDMDETCRSFLAAIPDALAIYYAAGALPLVTNLGKLVLQVQDSRGLHWLEYPGTPQLVNWYSQAISDGTLTLSGLSSAPSSNHADVPEKLLLQALLILKSLIRSAQQFTFANVASSPLDTPAPILHPSSPADAGSQFACLRAILSPPFAQGLAQVLMAAYLRPTASDLSAILTSPATWLVDEDNDHWEYRVRGCAARVLMELVLAFGEGPAGVMPTLVAAAGDMAAGRLDSLAMVAVVHALCGSADRVAKHVPYVPLFTDVLLPWARSARQAAAQGSPEAQLAARAVCMSISAFIASTAKEARPVIYSALARDLLVADMPLIVQLAGVDALRMCVDEWELEVPELLPYLGGLMERLLNLLAGVDEFDLKIKVVNCLSIVIERLDTHMVAFAQPIAEFIPSLWDEADEEYLFQATLLVMLKKLAAALRGQSPALHAIASPLLGITCVHDSKQSVYFLEDGLLLWHTLLQFTSVLTPELAALLPLVPPLLEKGSEALRSVLQILQSYLFLDPALVVNQIGAWPRISCCIVGWGYGGTARVAGCGCGRAGGGGSNGHLPSLPSVGIMRPQASAVITRVLETFLICAGQDALQLMVRRAWCTACAGHCDQARPQSGPHCVPVCPLACRLPHLAPRLCGHGGGPDTFVPLFTHWIDLWDHICHPAHRKLSALP